MYGPQKQSVTKLKSKEDGRVLPNKSKILDRIVDLFDSLLNILEILDRYWVLNSRGPTLQPCLRSLFFKTYQMILREHQVIKLQADVEHQWKVGNMVAKRSSRSSSTLYSLYKKLRYSHRTENSIVPLFRKGSRINCGNYRQQPAKSLLKLPNRLNNLLLLSVKVQCKVHCLVSPTVWI